jgi:hypothetical protein
MRFILSDADHAVGVEMANAWFISQGALRNPSGLWAITGEEVRHAEALPE